MAPFISGNRTSLRLDYLDPIRSTIDRLIEPSKQQYQDSIGPIVSCIDFMNEYGIDYEDVTDTLVELTFPPVSSSIPFYDPTGTFRQRIHNCKAVLHKEYNRRGSHFEILSTRTKGSKASSKSLHTKRFLRTTDISDTVALSMYGNGTTRSNEYLLGHNTEDIEEYDDDDDDGSKNARLVNPDDDNDDEHSKDNNDTDSLLSNDDDDNASTTDTQSSDK